VSLFQLRPYFHWTEGFWRLSLSGIQDDFMPPVQGGSKRREQGRKKVLIFNLGEPFTMLKSLFDNKWAPDN